MLPQQTQFRIFILLFVIFGSLALLMSSCGKYWVQTSDVFSGVWQTTCPSKSELECAEYERTEYYWITSVQAFMGVGITLLGISLLFFVFLISSPKAFSSKVLGFILGLAVISTVVGMSIYASYTSKYTYHWSYWLGWVGNLIIVVATGMCIHDARRPAPPCPYQNPMLGAI